MHFLVEILEKKPFLWEYRVVVDVRKMNANRIDSWQLLRKLHHNTDD